MRTCLEVTDLYAAALLLASDLELVNVKALPGTRKLSFCFSNPQEAERMVSDFYRGRAMVNGRRFVEAIRRIRDIRALGSVAPDEERNGRFHAMSPAPML